MTKSINNLNTTPETFNAEQFAELVNNVKRTQKAVLSIDENQKDAKQRYDAAMDNLQTAMDEGNLDDMQKFTAEAKRLKSKLGEDPAAKYQDFDEAINAMLAFFKPAESASVAPLHAVDEQQAVAA
jgi:hypothetical protein